MVRCVALFRVAGDAVVVGVVPMSCVKRLGDGRVGVWVVGVLVGFLVLWGRCVVCV